MTINFSRVAKPPGLQACKDNRKHSDKHNIYVTQRQRQRLLARLAQLARERQRRRYSRLKLCLISTCRLNHSNGWNARKTSAKLGKNHRQRANTDANRDVYSNYFQRKFSKRESNIFLNMPLVTSLYLKTNSTGLNMSANLIVLHFFPNASRRLNTGKVGKGGGNRTSTSSASNKRCNNSDWSNRANRHSRTLLIRDINF